MDNLQIPFATDLTDEQASTLTGGTRLETITCIDGANEGTAGTEPYIRNSAGNIVWVGNALHLKTGETGSVNKEFKAGEYIYLYESDEGQNSANDDYIGRAKVPAYGGPVTLSNGNPSTIFRLNFTWEV